MPLRRAPWRKDCFPRGTSIPHPGWTCYTNAKGTIHITGRWVTFPRVLQCLPSIWQPSLFTPNLWFLQAFPVLSLVFRENGDLIQPSSKKPLERNPAAASRRNFKITHLSQGALWQNTIITSVPTCFSPQISLQMLLEHLLFTQQQKSTPTQKTARHCHLTTHKYQM